MRNWDIMSGGIRERVPLTKKWRGSGWKPTPTVPVARFPGWSYRAPITIEEQSGSNLENYQVLVELNDTNFNFEDAQSNGEDIRFTLDDYTTLIDYWIEEWDKTNKSAKIWVKVPSVSASGTKLIYMYYGNPSASSTSNGDNTFKFFVNFDKEWTPYSGNPILSPEGAEVMSVAKSALKAGDTYYLYYGYTIGSHRVIGRATSNDGKSWAKDSQNNPVLNVGSGGSWDENMVTMPNVWKEGDTWYMLYYGRNNSGEICIGLATSTDGYTWAREGANPVLEGDTGQWDAGCVEPSGVIKVDSTYYLWYYASPRKVGLATSTNLTNWTKDGNNPIFDTIGDFDGDVFKKGDFYYMTLNCSIAPNRGEYRLYRSAFPTFPSSSREYLGIVLTLSESGWDNLFSEHLFVLTDNIKRDSYSASSNELWGYCSAYTAGSAFKVGLWIEPYFDKALEGNLKNWIEDTGAFTIEDSMLKSTALGENRLRMADVTVSTSEAIRLKGKWVGDAHNYIGNFFAFQDSHNFYMHRGKINGEIKKHYLSKKKTDAFSNSFYELYDWTENAFYVFETQWVAADEIRLLVDDILRTTVIANLESWTSGGAGIRGCHGPGDVGYVDWILVRKYTLPEPLISIPTLP